MPAPATTTAAGSPAGIMAYPEEGSGEVVVVGGDSPLKEEEDVGDLHDLVDASLRFTTMLKKKGVSQATLTVAVRNRPLSRRDRSLNAKASTRVMDDKVVVVMDPKEASSGGKADPRDAIRHHHNSKANVPGQGIKDKEKRYVFDRAFDTDATNQQVYKHVVQGMIGGLLKGLNATIFAYGATGSGKTHTMVGTERDPGLMVLSLKDVFRHIAKEQDKQWEVTCSYLEVYNEEIFDLLTSSSKALDLREDPELGPQPAGLRRIRVTTPEKIFSLLKEGNRRRKTESTDANATSSRSHAVLEVIITRTDRNHYEKQVSMGKLALVDLAGSERASETNNRGHQLKDGANINRSLLALANCINALGKRRKKGFVFVPFRNSKLTRLLKDGLCGNSRTAMVATVSCANTQYHHTLNTLKYADRAKEIKTHVRRNQGTVQEHVVEYQRIIDSLQQENRELKEQLAAADPAALQAALLEQHPDNAEDPRWVELTSAAINKAAVERLAQHRRVEACEDAARRASVALAAVESELDARASGAAGEAGGALSSNEELHRERAELAAAADTSRQEKARLSAQMAELEKARTTTMSEVASAPPGDGRERLKLEAAAARRELERVAAKENLATCDAVIREQAAVIANLWKVLEWAGLSHAQALGLAAQHAGPRQGPGGLQHELALGALAPALPGSGQPGVVEPVGAVRLEQLLTGSAARQFYSQWTEHRETSRHSLSTPDTGPRRQSLSLNRKSSNAEDLQKLKRRSGRAAGTAARAGGPSDTAAGAAAAPRKKASSVSQAPPATAATGHRSSARAAALARRGAQGQRGPPPGERAAAAAAAATAEAPGAEPGELSSTLSAEKSEWVEVTGNELDISDAALEPRSHPRSRHPGTRIPANNPSSYSNRARSNSHRDSTNSNIPRYAALRRTHRPKSSNVKVRLSGSFSRPQSSSNQSRKLHQPLSAKSSVTQGNAAVSSSLPDADRLVVIPQDEYAAAAGDALPESPNAWAAKEEHGSGPLSVAGQGFGFAPGAGAGDPRRETIDSVDEEARPETVGPRHGMSRAEQRSARRSPERRPQPPIDDSGPPVVHGRNPSARARVRASAEPDLMPAGGPRASQVAPSHERKVSRSFEPQRQPKAPRPQIEVDVSAHHEGEDPVHAKTVSPTRRGISKLLSLSRIRRRSSTTQGGPAIVAPVTE